MIPDEWPLSREQTTVVGLVVAVVIASALAPMLLAPSPSPETEADARVGQTYHSEDQARANGSARETLAGTTLHDVPDSLVEATPSDTREDSDVADPSVRTSDGSQSMTVEAIERDDEVRLVLEDDRTHDGRWVSVSTTWLRETVGSVPAVVRVTHESGGAYVSTLRQRGDSGVFWVREFSTNTVSFESTVELRAESATNGSTMSYEIDDLDATSDPTATVTGVASSEWDNVSATGVSDGDTLDLAVAGNRDPSGPNGQPVVTFEGIGQPQWDNQSFSSISSSTVDLGIKGNLDPTGPQGVPVVVLKGNKQTSTGSLSKSGVGSTTLSPSIGGNSQPESVDLQISTRSYSKSYSPIGVNDHWVKMKEWTVPESGLYVGKFSYCIHENDPGDMGFKIEVNGNKVGENRKSGTGRTCLTHAIEANANSGDTVSLWGIDYTSQFSYDSYSVSLSSHYNSISAKVNGNTYNFGTNGGTKTLSMNRGDNIDVNVDGYPVDISLDWTEVTLTDSPSVDVGADGSPEVSLSSQLSQGETTTRSLSSLSTTQDSVQISTQGAPVDVSFKIREENGTKTPGVDLDQDGVVDREVNKTLRSGESSELSLGSLSVSTDQITIMTNGATNVSVALRERSTTPPGDLVVNGQSRGFGGLKDGESESITLNSSVLREGTNTVEIRTSGSLSADAPIPKVSLDYRHDVRDNVSLDYQAEQFSERYNVSKTYATEQANATLTIPFDGRVVSIRNLEVRINQTNWTTVTTADRSLDGTTLTVDLSGHTGGAMPTGTIVEVRTTGSKAVANNATLEVTDPQVVGERPLDVGISLSGWDDTSYLGVSNTGLSDRLLFAADTSWESDVSTQIDAEGRQRLFAPNLATVGSGDLRLRSAPVAATVGSGQTHFVVENASRTNVRVGVRPGPTTDTVTLEHLNASGTWNLLTTESVVIDSAEATDGTVELSLSENRRTVVIAPRDSSFSSSGGDDNAGAFGPGGTGGGALDRVTVPLLGSLGTLSLFGSQLIPLVVVATLLAGVLLASRTPDAVPESSAAVSTLSSIPLVGDTLGRSLAGLVSGASDVIERVLSSRIGTAGLVAAIVLAGVASGAIPLPEGGINVLLVLTVAGLSFVALREAGEFTLERWLSIVTLSTATLIVSSSNADPVAAILDSQLFPLVVLGGLALAFRLIQGLRAEADTPDTVNRIVVDDNGGGD